MQEQVTLCLFVEVICLLYRLDSQLLLLTTTMMMMIMMIEMRMMTMTHVSNDGDISVAMIQCSPFSVCSVTLAVGLSDEP